MRARTVTTAPGIDLVVHEAGSAGDPLVVLLHGFPETAHSWRHQMEPLAGAGYHVLAPDQRGYASSSAPPEMTAYRADHLAADVIALLDDSDAEHAVMVGHDWGALVAWHLGQLHPRRCRKIVGASVPYTPWPMPPTELMAMAYDDRFFYILHFQAPGVAEVELAADPARFLRAIYWVASGETKLPLSSDLPASGTDFTTALEHALGYTPIDPPHWISPTDFRFRVEQFETSGFLGPVNWYRNFDPNYELTAGIGASPLTMPTYFIAGADDPVLKMGADPVAAMEATLPNHRRTELLDDIGHWVQQEAPDDFTRVLLEMLGDP